MHEARNFDNGRLVASGRCAVLEEFCRLYSSLAFGERHCIPFIKIGSAAFVFRYYVILASHPLLRHCFHVFPHRTGCVCRRIFPVFLKPQQHVSFGIWHGCAGFACHLDRIDSSDRNYGPNTASRSLVKWVLVGYAYVAQLSSAMWMVFVTL